MAGKRLKDKRVKSQIIIGFAGLFLAGVLYVANVFISLPKPEEIAGILQAAESVQIYDRTGKVLLSEAAGGRQRSILPSEEIPDRVRQATLAIEDASFYDHGAFEWKGILRAVTVNITQGRLAQGGSTITQQLARNAFLTPEKTITRKIKEGVLAVRLEQYYGKDQILDLYLNHIPYGRNFYGVEAASQAFFGKPARELTLAEVALVAAIPQAPTYYSPWGAHVPELMERKNLVLKRMKAQGYIDESGLDAALNEKVQFADQPIGVIKAPHFVNYIQEYLAQKYGEEAVQAGDFKVITTLDWELQQIAEEAVKKGAEKNVKQNAGANGAFLAMDPQTGQILAMVGSKNYFAPPEPEGCIQGKTCRFEGNFNVATQGLRQPGSALKPFVYLAAFKEGLTPDTITWDTPTEFNTSCPLIPDFSTGEGSCYHPRNFDQRFRGPVKLKEALAQSINVPAVKVLYFTGVNNAIETAKRFGITSLTDPKRYGLSLVLGGGEVRLIEMVSAYSVLATEGIYHKPVSILRVEDSQGNILEEHKDDGGEEVVEPQYPRLVNAILSSGVLRSPLYSASFGLTQVPGYEVAVKTGTTDNYVDAWTFGYTPNLVAGIWVGNNNQASTHEGSSILAALPIWHEFMFQAVPKRPFAAFNPPDPVSPLNPILRGELTDGYHDLLYYLGRGGEAQSSFWEAGVAGWLQSNTVDLNRFNLDRGESTPSLAPNSRGGLISIEILSPQNGAFVNRDVGLTFAITSPNPINKVEVYLNGKLFDNRTGGLGKKFNYKKGLPFDDLRPQNLLVIQATGESGASAEEELIFFSQ